MTEVKLRKGEPVEKALRRLKRLLNREQTLQTAIAVRDKVVAAYQEITRMAI